MKRADYTCDEVNVQQVSMPQRRFAALCFWSTPAIAQGFWGIIGGALALAITPECYNALVVHLTAKAAALPPE